MRGTMRWFASFAWLALIAVVGCAESQDPVNRVQPNAVAKSTFNGEFYFLETVVDTPYSTQFTFVGNQGSLQKIRWEIQEDFLVARRTYEFISGSEGEGLAGEATETGAAVAMFAIESHFDIRREYNPLTGEETNVISENNQDRPWYERDYIRVDWSRNLMQSSDFLSLSRLFDEVKVEPMAWFPNDPNHPFAPRFEKNESGEVYYMDIVNKAFVTPPSITFPGWGTIPSCYMYYNDMVDCQPNEVSVRHSFLRVEDRDYEPNLYTGDRMEKFGYFETPRMGYNTEYGIVEPSRVHFNNRHNLWVESHRKNTDGSLVTCTSNDECNPEEGSVCDMALAVAYRRPQGACTIPYRERQIRKIAYHVSANFPADLLPDTQDLVNEWNKAFVATVESLRFNECDAAGYEGCESERERADGKSVFVMCHNPVLATDDAACGGEGTSAQIGDLRYHLLGWVNEPHLSAPLGYGPSAADPETGELIQANAFVYGAAVETLATNARDLIALLNGDLTPEQINSGDNVQQWVERQLFNASRGEAARPAHEHAVPLDGFDAPRINEAMNFDWARDPSRPAGRPTSPAEVVSRFEEARQRLTRNGMFGNGTNVGEARLAAVRGTPIETLMTTVDHRLAVNAPATGPISEELMDRASPLRGMSPAAMRQFREMRDRLQTKACILNTDFADEGLLGLALAIKRAAEGDGIFSWYGVDYDLLDEEGNLDQSKVRDMIRHPIYHAVMGHEVGHTVGLRHNFSGSYDSINYDARYWELRNDGNMQSRAYDPITQAEIDGRIREHATSTLMDYGVNFVVTDANGIGHYDYAAIKMGYGDLVEVYRDAPSQGAAQAELLWYHLFSGFGWPFVTDFATATGEGFNTLQYTDYPRILGGGANTPAAVATGVQRLEERDDVPYTSLRAFGPFGAGLDEPIVDARNRAVVPYLFCSDEQADLGPDCQRYDAGADWYETITSVTDSYWDYYMLASFRRNRVGFNPNSYINRTYGRYFEKLQSANQYYALFRPIIGDAFGVPQNDPAWTTGGLGAVTAGVGVAYNLFTRVITAPEVGSYFNGTRPDGSPALLTSGEGDPALTLGVLDGRYIETTWDFDLGYYWFGQIERVGFFFDKALAIMALTDPTTYFVGRDTSADIREYQLNFYTTFGPSLSGMFRNLLADDWSAIAPRATSATELEYLDPLDFVTDGPGTGTPVDPNASFSVQLYASLYSMMYIPQLYDQTFMNSARIAVQGGAESIDFDGPTIEFMDPDSGITYEAASYIVDGRETGVGARMLQHAEDLANAPGQETAFRKYMDNINIIRFLTWNLGFGVL
jgi:hypothetical protein